MAHIRQSRPDSGPGFQVKVIETISGVSSSLGSGTTEKAQSSREFIAESIQFGYDPDDLATKIATQLVHKRNSKTCV